MRKTSGLITTSQAIMTAGGIYYGMVAEGGNTGLNRISIYHHSTTNAGQLIDEGTVTSGNYYHSNHGDEGIPVNSGLYAQVTGTVRAVIWFKTNALQGNT